MEKFFVLLFLVFSILPASAVSVPLSWNASTNGVVGYNIYRDGVKIGTSATTTFIDTTASPSATYTYTVTAFDAAGNESSQSTSATISTLAGTTTTFVPLHKYYIAASGCSDRNAGTSSGSPWCTPNHSVVCGDVIIAAAGSYNRGQFGSRGASSFGTVSSCPSRTGGIDGAGGIYFAILLCGGSDLMSCTVEGGSGPAFEVGKSNWSIQGFKVTQRTDADRSCFSALGTSSGTMWHHVAWINNIASTCDLAGFSTGNVGIQNAGLDQIAIVGGIVYNGANSLGPYRVCGSGISIIPAPQNTDAGTHVFISQNFVYKSTNSPGATECTVGGDGHPHSDGEGIIFDTWGGTGGFAAKGVAKNNVMWLNGNSCFQVFPQGNGTTDDKAQIYFTNNTCWSNNQDPRAACLSELWLHGVYPTVAGGSLVSVSNNIFLATMKTCGNRVGAQDVIAVAIFADANHATAVTNPPVTVFDNYIFRNVPPTNPDQYGDRFWNTYVVNNSGGAPVFDAPWIFGTNTLQDPGLTKPDSLPTSAPDCTGYTNTVDCMLVKYNVYNFIRPTIASSSKGYQPPTDCASDSDFPTWLKGVIYLQVSGSNIIQASGMITAPCGL